MTESSIVFEILDAEKLSDDQLKEAISFRCHTWQAKEGEKTQFAPKDIFTMEELVELAELVKEFEARFNSFLYRRLKL